MSAKLIEKIPPKYKEKIFILPAMLTLGNAICGTFAILSALSLEFERSAYYIVFAMLLDALDGRISRITKSSTQFGIQLDSLADAISFGLAPALITWMMFEENYTLPPNLQNSITILYICCAIIRLARFNVETDTSEESHLYFKGLPSPGAALFVTFNILLFSKLANSKIEAVFINYLIDVYKYLLPLIVCIAAILMVTNIRYVHIFNISLAGYKSKKKFVEIMLLLLLILVKPLISLWLISWVFIFYPIYEKYIKYDKKPILLKYELPPKSTPI